VWVFLLYYGFILSENMFLDIILAYTLSSFERTKKIGDTLKENNIATAYW
jgi:hypothetical protein